MGTFVLLILSFVDESMHPMMLAWLLLAIALIALALVARRQADRRMHRSRCHRGCVSANGGECGDICGYCLVVYGAGLRPLGSGDAHSGRGCSSPVRGLPVSAYGGRRRTQFAVVGDQNTPLLWGFQRLESSSRPSTSVITGSSISVTPTGSSSLAYSWVQSSSASPSCLERDR